MPTEIPETFVDANKNKEVEAALRQWLTTHCGINLP